MLALQVGEDQVVRPTSGGLQSSCYAEAFGVSLMAVIYSTQIRSHKKSWRLAVYLVLF